MKKQFSALALALALLCMYQCADKKQEVSSTSTPTTVVVANPELGGYDSQMLWGEHLVTITGCNDCHTPKKMTDRGPIIDTSLRLSGHPAMMPRINVDRKAMEKKGYVTTMDLTEWVGPWGVSYAANLTPDQTGLGGWTIENFTRALREGKFKGIESGRQMLPPMPWDMFKHMTDYEIKAIFAYLQSIKPISNIVPAALPPVTAMAPPAPAK